MTAANILEQHKITQSAILQLVRGDITQEHVDAIVNPANAYLQHGGGVAGAIARSGGPQIQIESDAWIREHGAVTHQHPTYTNAGNLPCRYVIHAVGPVWGSGDEDAKLAAAVSGSLNLAEKLNLGTIAIPAISTGIFGFPKDRAASVIFNAVIDYFHAHPSSSLHLVRITLYDDATIRAFNQVWHARFENNQ